MGTSTTANAAEAEAIETETRRKGCFSFSTFAFVVTTPPGISSSSSRFGRTRRPFSVNYHRRPPPLPLRPIKKDEQTTLDGTQCSFNRDHSAFFFYRVLPSTSTE